MKIVKVKATRQRISGKTHYTYPPEYDAKKIKVLAYETQSEAGRTDVGSRGDTDEYLIGVVKDEDLNLFLASDDIEEIDRAQAVTLGNKWKPVKKYISDKDSVINVLDKVARKQQLTAEDEKIINADDDAPGINKTRSIDSLLDESGVSKVSVGRGLNV